MTKDDKKQFSAMIKSVAQLFDKKITSGMMQVYWDCVQDYQLEHVRLALTYACKKSKFFPKPADIQEFMSGTPDEAAALGFDKLITAIRSSGSIASVVFDDPVIHVVVDQMGGWLKVCKWETNELAFRQHDYVKRHTMLQRIGVQSWPCKLKGSTELANQDHYPEWVPPPVFVGNRDAALSVLAGGLENFTAIEIGMITHDEQRRLAGRKNSKNAQRDEVIGRTVAAITSR